MAHHPGMAILHQSSPPPIADDLFDYVDADGSIALIGGIERGTGRIAFPFPAQDDGFERARLPREGSLWSWTVQRFRPKSPPYAGADAFEDYAVGYVALGDAIIVEGRLTGAEFGDLRIGMAMRVVPQIFAMADGSQRTTYAFAPAQKGPST